MKKSKYRSHWCKTPIFAIIFLIINILATFSWGQSGPQTSIKIDTIPEPARAYVMAVADENLDALTACFDAKAVIIEVNRRIEGIDAIRQWAENEVIGGKLDVLELKTRQNGVTMLVTFTPGGWTNGFRAYYRFDFKNKKIIKADLQYAD